eukprot:1157725-Pelagomonas_calceolata.AAC.9
MSGQDPLRDCTSLQHPPHVLMCNVQGVGVWGTVAEQQRPTAPFRIVWDTATSTCRAIFRLPGEISSVALSSDGCTCITGCEDEAVRWVWVCVWVWVLHIWRLLQYNCNTGCKPLAASLAAKTDVVCVCV